MSQVEQAATHTVGQGARPEPHGAVQPAVLGGHLLDMDALDAAAVTAILDTAKAFGDLATRPIKKVPTLRGRTVCNLFFEDSTRTRVSFEVAAKRLSADVLNFSAKGSSVSKGESLKDTALTLQAMGVDAVVVRHHTSGAPHQLTRWLDAKVLNAGDGRHQHPTQALLDLYTIREHFGRLGGLHVAVVGDVLHSRVARSLVQGLRTMSAGVTLVGPPTLLPMSAGEWDVEVSHDLDPVLGKADVVYLLRVQQERMREQFIPSIREYARLWGVDRRRLGALADHAVIMHPGPMNRGVELTADVADAPNALITQQVANGIAVRMSCLYLMLGGEHASERVAP
ncbi:MAG TPA: aspartate carbamoyltransferase catalytic subunit [Euzebyales bacterium]|nr:aspartate carbamoyltransferase catalytic subunit [Euzebyales bacterium]